MDIGRCIQDARIQAGLTQSQLAEELNRYGTTNNMGFSKKFGKNDIEQWENNRKEIKQAGIIVAMAKILKTDCHILLTGTDRKDQTLADELSLTGNTLQTFRINKKHAELCNFFFDNRILGRNLLLILDYLKRYIETPLKEVQIEGEENSVLLSDVRKVVLDKGLTWAQTNFQSGLRAKSHQRKEKGVTSDGETGKWGRISKKEE